LVKEPGNLTGIIKEYPDKTANLTQKKKTESLKISEEELRNFFKLKAQYNLGERV
jgi:hypothetical protein